jgi:DNA-binding MarR family transcriptional regulator
MLKKYMKTYIVSNEQEPGRTTQQGGDHWLGKFVPYLIYRITNHLNQSLRKRLRRSGINISRWRVLAVLKDHGRLNMSQIVEHTIIEQPTVSRIVDQLEREGLAVRETCGEDSRFVQVSLTLQGELAFQEFYPIATRHQEVALQGFEQKEIETLIGFLERIQNNISANQPGER